MDFVRLLTLWVTIPLVFLMPWLIVWQQRPSQREIVQTKVDLVGSLTTRNNSVLDVYIVYGNVFRPREARSDTGFDLVALSLYFDPISVNGEAVLVGNPVLNSALYESRGSKEEARHLFGGVLAALHESRRVVECYLVGEQTCEGDQITPFVWPALAKSRMSANGVKYLCALPLFDPAMLFAEVPPQIGRKRLAENVSASVRRLLTYAADELGTTVHSLALPALGSTSHKGGDSPYFLTFEEGFLTIVEALAESRPPPSLDRAYLVGYDLHRGVFREEVLAALQSVADYFTLRMLVGPEARTLLGGGLAALYLLIGACLYQNVYQILRQKNRWAFMGTLLAVTSGLGTANYAAFVAVVGTGAEVALAYALPGYSVMAAFNVLLLTWLSKRIKWR